MCRSSFEENYPLFFEGKSLSLFNINQVSISVGKYLYFCGSAAALLTAIFIVNITLIISYKNSFIQILKITLRAGLQYFVSGRFYTEDALSSLRSRRLEERTGAREGDTRGVQCLLLARPYFLLPTTSKRLLCRLPHISVT